MCNVIFYFIILLYFWTYKLMLFLPKTPEKHCLFDLYLCTIVFFVLLLS